MTKRYALSLEEVAYFWALLERLNSFFHADRSFEAFTDFQKENYRYIAHAYYSILSSKVSDDVIEVLSELDTGPGKSFAEEVALALRAFGER